MHEIEIKFQIDPARRDRVAAEVIGPRLAGPPPRRQHLQAAYFDTADRALAEARIALRVRREGRCWVQTLKGAADDGMTRFEHNVDLPSGSADTPMADPALHAGTEVGDRLARVIAASKSVAAAGESSSPLVCLYRTDVWRRTRLVRTRPGTVELAFDEGQIIAGIAGIAGEATLPLCELEFELKSGSPLAVIETARKWVVRHGLAYDTRSKSERGDMLARGVSMASPRHAVVVRLTPTMTVPEAERAVMRSCLDQISVNASQVASGAFEDDHLHQLRVGLRRLRTALRWFEADPASTIVTRADALFHALGAARDRSALGPVASAIRTAMVAAGVDLQPPTLVDPATAGDVVAIVRASAAQELLLDLLTVAQDIEAPPVADVRHDAALRLWTIDRLKRLHRHLIAEVDRFDALDDAGRHHLRRRAKRLRYAVEFGASLFGRKPVARYLKSLRGLQQRLGELTDVAVALGHLREPALHDPAAAFAAGWLIARHDTLVDRCRPALKRFAGVEKFWKSR